MATVSAVDLFCGAGGLTCGLQKAGIKVHAGYDIDLNSKFAFEHNNRSKFCHEDISDISSSDISSWYPDGDIKLLAGCAPCQPFSTYSQGKDAKKSNKWPLLYQFTRLIEGVNPELVTMENVPNVTKHQVYHDFVKRLSELGYNIWSNSVYCPDYGIPQTRTRHVLLASKLGPIELLKPTHHSSKYRTVKDAIEKLPSIKAGKPNNKDPLHQAANLSELNQRRIKASSPGGSWSEWPEELLASCHKKESGKTYTGVYARMAWDTPSPTMTTQCYGYGNGRFGHPEQNRAISLREAALFQTFPKPYKFIKPTDEINFTIIGKMIGNAVPVELGKVIGRSLKMHLQQNC